MKSNSVTVQNILHVGEEQLKEWNVPLNDILDYKRVKKEEESYGRKFNLTMKPVTLILVKIVRIRISTAVFNELLHV